MKKSKLSRVFEIVTIFQSGQPCKIDDLIKLSGVSRRTIFRDLKEIQQANVPCYYDRKQKHYTIKSDYLCSTPSLSCQEALGLFLLVYKARNYINMPFCNLALKAALKTEANLPNHIKRYCNTVLQNVTIKSEPQTQTNLLDKIFFQLLEAVLKNRILIINYYSLRTHKIIITNLEPYHLIYNDKVWYVIGKSSIHKKIRSFELNQIKRLKSSNKYFISDKQFDIQEYLGRSWSITREGRLFNVKLRFLPEIAHSVANIQWHRTQTVEFEEDGSVVIEFRVDGLSEITWWILGYGNLVQVLAPKTLRQKIITIAQQVIVGNGKVLS